MQLPKVSVPNVHLPVFVVVPVPVPVPVPVVTVLVADSAFLEFAIASPSRPIGGSFGNFGLQFSKTKIRIDWVRKNIGFILISPFSFFVKSSTYNAQNKLFRLIPHYSN